MSRAVTLPTMPETRVSRTLEPSLAVLIEVPAVQVQTNKAFPADHGTWLRRSSAAGQAEQAAASSRGSAWRAVSSWPSRHWSRPAPSDGRAGRPAFSPVRFPIPSIRRRSRDDSANPHDPDGEADLERAPTTGCLGGLGSIDRAGGCGTGYRQGDPRDLPRLYPAGRQSRGSGT